MPQFDDTVISTLIKISLAVGGVYLLLVLGLYFGQKRLVYVPDRTRVDPGTVGLKGVEELSFKRGGDVRLLAWYAKASPGQPTFLYFHGNAGNLAGREDRIKAFQNAGYGVLMMSYRSYGGSTGAPSEKANISDGLYLVDWLKSEAGDPARIVLYGESLGTGVAVQVAAKRDVAGVVLDAPYTSLVDVARMAYPFVPVGPFLTERYRSDLHISRINAPLLILHGARDSVIPVSFGRALFEMAQHPKKLVVFPQGSHSDLYSHGALDAVRLFIQGLRK